MNTDFEDKYENILQNLESAIHSIHQEMPNLLDYHVEDALEALTSKYSAVVTGRPPKPHTLTGERLAVYQGLEQIGNWCLGQLPLVDADGKSHSFPKPISPEELIACLKRIRKSVKMWTKQMGRQGYLTFITQFFPQ